MDIELEPATADEKPVLERLMQLYQHDLSEFNGKDVDASGIFPYRYLDSYWVEPDRFPFLLRAGGNIAGFALVRRGAMLDADPDTMEVAEFSILRRYRRQGLGRTAAYRLFDRFPARWEVRHDASNLPAERFWREAIAAYTSGNFERITDDPRWDGTAYRFTSGQGASNRANPSLLKDA